MINILCFSVKEEGAKLHADSSGAVEEERQRERSSGQEKGRTFYTTDAHSTFDSVQIRMPFFWCPTLNLFVLTGGRI